eukprot:4920116-Amphidinium_carterae.1
MEFATCRRPQCRAPLPQLGQADDKDFHASGNISLWATLAMDSGGNVLRLFSEQIVADWKVKKSLHEQQKALGKRQKELHAIR